MINIILCIFYFFYYILLYSIALSWATATPSISRLGLSLVFVILI